MASNSFLRGDAEHAHPCALHQRQRDRNGCRHQGDVTAGKVVERGLDALVRDMVHLDAQRGLEQFAIEVLRGSRPGRAEGEAARGGARKLDQVRDRADRKRRIDQQDFGGKRNERDRNEVGERIVGQVLVQGDVGRERRAGRDHERVAVRRRAHHRDGARHRARAGPVLDHERFSVQPLELAADQPGKDAVHAARRRRRHDGDGARGIVLRARRRRRQRRQHGHANDGGPM